VRLKCFPSHIYSNGSDAQELLGPSFRSGILLANPIPKAFAIPKAEINAAIDQAVQEAAVKGIHGYANTPFILARIKELTKGNSIPANRALIESNVAMAASVASYLCGFRDNSIVDHSSP
jgi:pseudouridylate synthase / pseudouridine kinase